MASSSAEVEASGYANLCTSVPGSCEYAPLATAPLLRSDVCHKLPTGTTTIMSGGTCNTNERPYYVEYGEVIGGLVVSYIALADACDQGYCDIFPPGTPQGDIVEICCTDTSTCYTDLSQCASGAGEIVWCTDTQDNQDGTVTCADDS